MVLMNKTNEGWVCPWMFSQFSPRLAQQLLRQVCDQALDMINAGFTPPVFWSLSFFNCGGKVQQKQTNGGGRKLLRSKQFIGRM